MMQYSEERDLRTYFVVIIGALVFVMLYIWQSVEVTKIRLEYQKLLKHQEQLVKQNDRLVYEIEQLRTIGALTKEAEKRGMRRIAPGDFERIEVK
jgi:cell division protein FtsL